MADIFARFMLMNPQFLMRQLSESSAAQPQLSQAELAQELSWRVKLQQQQQQQSVAAAISSAASQPPSLASPSPVGSLNPLLPFADQLDATSQLALYHQYYARAAQLAAAQFAAAQQQQLYLLASQQQQHHPAPQQQQQRAPQSPISVVDALARLPESPSNPHQTNHLHQRQATPTQLQPAARASGGGGGLSSRGSQPRAASSSKSAGQPASASPAKLKLGAPPSVASCDSGSNALSSLSELVSEMAPVAASAETHDRSSSSLGGSPSFGRLTGGGGGKVGARKHSSHLSDASTAETMRSGAASSTGNNNGNGNTRDTLDLISSAAQALANHPNSTPLAKAPPELIQKQPAWVFCTRYSDRPSSGPRTRRAKSKDKKAKDPKAAADEKRPRTAFTSEQLEKLRQEFNANSYLDEKRRKDLAERLLLNENQIKIWFQNKRAKMKKQNSQPNPLRGLLVAGGLYNHSTATSDCSEFYANGDDLEDDDENNGRDSTANGTRSNNGDDDELNDCVDIEGEASRLKFQSIGIKRSRQSFDDQHNHDDFGAKKAKLADQNGNPTLGTEPDGRIVDDLDEDDERVISVS